MSPGKLIVAGFGSDALTDDGLPVHLIHDMREIFSRKPIEFRTSPVGGMELMDILEGFDIAMLIDTQLTGRRPPGEISVWELPDFEETFHLSSQHDVSFTDALKLGKMMELHMPGKILVVAVEVIDNKTLNFELSNQIREKYPFILSYLCRLLVELSGKNGQ